MKSLSLLLIAILTLSGCASFSGRIVRKSKIELSEATLNRLNGTYALFPDMEYNNKGNAAVINSRKTAEANSFYYFVSDKKTEFDSIENYTLQLKLINSRKIHFVFRKGDAVIENIEMGGKLKSNGLFHLDNTYVKCHGIPFILGGCTSHKTRIGISKDNGLLVNQANDLSGAFLLVIGDGYAYNSAYHFKRIE